MKTKKLNSKDILKKFKIKFGIFLIAFVTCYSGLINGDLPVPRFETEIVFNGYDSGETLTNFPALVVLNTNISGFSYADFVSPANGADLRFTSTNRSKFLNYEIENWNTNGISRVWVQVDLLASNTSVYAMWGNSGWSTAPAYSTNGATWNADYEAVWHLSEVVISGATTTNAYRDSTANHRDGNQVGNSNTNGPIGLAQYFDGSNDYINVPDTIVSTADLTISAWLRPDGSDGWDAIINHDGWSAGNIHYQFPPADQSLYYAQYNGPNLSLTGFAFAMGEWHHVVTVFDRSAGGSDGVLTFYVDGELKQTSTGLVATLNPSLTPGHIGNWDTFRYFKGAMDEFRILNSAPSSNWFHAAWLTAASNAQFSSYGEVQHEIPTPIHYVSPTGGNVAPYGTWADAATNIQDAINAATTNDTVLVTNGTYNLPATITMSHALILASVNGRDVTIISGGGNKTCLNLANYAVVVDGFTIRDGYTQYGNGGGVTCSGTTPVITNCVLTANTAFHGAGSYMGTLNNCILRDNSCNYSGGGTCQSILNNCTISGNTCLSEGGGVYHGSATDCTIIDNSGGWGGGSSFATLNNCTVSGNRAVYYYGGGCYYGTANNCTIIDNHAEDSGGGSAYSTLNNCVISGNSAPYNGGGANYGTLNNCTLTDNTAGNSGGGSYQGNVRNCIVYNNYVGSTESNYYNGTYTYSCTRPLPAGTGNIADDPILLSTAHIATNSPCVGAGSSAYASGTDIDGESWKNPPSMGCDEIYPGALTGSLNVAIVAERTYAYPGIPLSFLADIDGKPTHTTWSFGDGGGSSNSYKVSHAWSGAGNYPVILTAFNTSNPGGIAATVTVQVITETIHYVSPSGNNVAPYTTWDNAANSIQDAAEVASDGGSVVVTDGTYHISSEIGIEADINVRSVNGPGATVVEADGSCRVFNPGGNSCLISGFTVTNGNSSKGGGIFCYSTTPVISNCTITGNSSTYGAGSYYGTLNNCIISGNTASQYGGGAYRSALNNSLIKGNSAEENGGGAYYSTLNNCTVADNSAGMEGGGTAGSIHRNCIIYYNPGWWNANYSGGSFTNCCTTPDPGSGTGNITNAPQFVSNPPFLNGAGGFRLRATSPCINTGTNAFAPMPFDLDGKPRIIYGTVDMGCYEYTWPPFIDITNYPSVIEYPQTTAEISGTNVNIAGQLGWTSDRNPSATNFFPQGFSTTIDNLVTGMNYITVLGTNLYNQSANDVVCIQRKTWTESEPQIATNALIFPEKNSVIFASQLTNIIWNVEKITDDIDGTNLTITKIDLHYADTTNFILEVTNNIANTLGEIEWYVPPGSWTGETNYVLKFEVVDSSSLTNSRIFWDNKFIIVPEGAFGAINSCLLLVVAIWRKFLPNHQA